MDHIILPALVIGIATGLRSLTGPAAVSWAACLGGLDLHGSPLAFMGSRVAVAIFSLLALAEYVVDKLPQTPSRTRLRSLITRLVLGALCGASLSGSASGSLFGGAVLGIVGALIGTFGGYEIRRRLVRSLKVKDGFIAVPEDLIAIGLAFLAVAQR
nr:putative membrane protein Rv2120c [uncultured bacterium]